MSRVLFLFLDGVGIGPEDDRSNPFFRAHLPNLADLLGRRIPHLEQPTLKAPGAVAFPLDACLGVEGLPQSGTGQAALLTGENAPHLFGRHFGPWVPARLRPLVQEKNLLVRARQRGFDCVFANAYPKEFYGSPWERRPAGPPLAAMAADLMALGREDLARGQALSSEIVNHVWRERLGYSDLPDISPEEAGRNLARVTAGADLTFFAHYNTDYAGHRGKMDGSIRALERVDRFLGGIFPHLPAHTFLLVASDHGNIEDTGAGHTRNPTLALLAGPGAPARQTGLTRITQLPDLVLDLLTSD